MSWAEPPNYAVGENITVLYKTWPFGTNTNFTGVVTAVTEDYFKIDGIRGHFKRSRVLTKNTNRKR